jgi:acetyl-CoA C-acetyltransferase
MGNGEMIDSMVSDGLWDPYGNKHMGKIGELCADEFGIPRDRQDDFAAQSYRRALAAQEAGKFAAEIAPVAVPQRRGEPVLVDSDEEPGKGRIDKLPSLRPAFTKDGTITAGNASSINDGAAAVVVMSEAKAIELGAPILARIRGYSTFAQDPDWFTTAPAFAIEGVLAKTGLEASDIDLWEVNEAFAVVALAVQDKIGYESDNVNIWGGAVALGHPIGCSGTRILVTLLHQLEDEGKSLGCASLCIGGGEAVAMVVEKITEA